MGTVQAGEWERRSPEGALAFDVARAGSRLLLGTSDGLHVSDDDGSSWRRVVSIPSSQAVHAIGVSPHVADHWYIVVRESYLESGSGFRPVLYRDFVRETRDSGQNWQPPTFRAGVTWLPIFHPTTDRLLVVWRNNHAWQYSGNGGSTWTEYTGISELYAVGLALPGHPFGALDLSTFDYTTMEFRLGSADGSSFGPPIATLNLAGSYGYHKLMQRAVPSQAFWIAQRPVGSTELGSVDFVSGQLVRLPSYDGNAYQVFDDEAAPGTVLLFAEREETDYAQRFGVSTLHPGATQWNLRGGIEQSLKGFPRVGAPPHLLNGGGAQLWLSDASVGLHRSDDSGVTWQVHNAGLRAAAVNAVLLDPRNPDHLLAGRDMQSLQRSVDGGLHWSDVGGSVPHDVRALARSPVDPDHLLATARGGLHRSRDAGLTWQVVPSAIDPVAGAPGWHEIVWCANSDTHLLATVYRNLYRSTDGGASWTFLRTNLYGASFGLQTARQAPHSVYVSNGYFEDGARVLRTDDCGVTFVTVALGDSSNRTLAVSPYDSRVVAIAVHPPGNYAEDRIAVSNDGGANWTLTEVPAWEAIGSTTPVGWYHGCETTVLTTAAFLTANGTLLASRPELPRQTNWLTQARAADSHCVDGQSVAVVGLHDGVWLHRPDVQRIFSDGFDGP